MTLEIDRIYCGDCLELMQRIPDRSIDAIITDPPYGTTRNRWDIQIPLRAMWERVRPDTAKALIEQSLKTSVSVEPVRRETVQTTLGAIT